MLKSNDETKWNEDDITPIVEYCVTSGVSASLNQKSKELFNEWIKPVLKVYPKEGTVITIKFSNYF